MKKSEDSLGPELSSIMKDDAVRWFDTLRSARTALTQSVQSRSLTSSRSVKDDLIFAYFRKVLDLVELPLEQGFGGTGVDIFDYWANRGGEFRRLCTTGSEIASYLLPSGSKTDIAQEAKKKIFGLLPKELVFVGVPVLGTFFAVPGAPVKMRSIAVRALQMKIDKGWTLGQITNRVCPCGEATHGPKCQQNLRQSMIALKKLLVRCGIELPAPKPTSRSL